MTCIKLVWWHNTFLWSDVCIFFSHVYFYYKTSCNLRIFGEINILFDLCLSLSNVWTNQLHEFKTFLTKWMLKSRLNTCYQQCILYLLQNDVNQIFVILSMIISSNISSLKTHTTTITLNLDSARCCSIDHLSNISGVILQCSMTLTMTRMWTIDVVNLKIWPSASVSEWIFNNGCS